MHGARFLGCPYLMQCKENLKISVMKDIVFKEAQTKLEQPAESTRPKKSSYKRRVDELKEQLKRISQQTERQINKESTTSRPNGNSQETAKLV